MARSKRGRNVKSQRSSERDFSDNKSNNKSVRHYNSKDDKDTEEKSGLTEPDKDVRSSGGTANDPAWYSRDPALLQAAGNIPFSEPMGSDYGLSKIEGNSEVEVQSETYATSLPGICALTVKPSIGYNIDRNSPINVAAQAFYTHVRYVNSGRKNYDQADLMIYALAISDIYSYIMYMQRIYALAFMYSQRNYFIGKNLLTAMDVDADSVISNLANYRYRLNAFINKVSTFAVPADIALFNRRAFMYAGVYTESQEGFIKDQLYFFKPDGFYKYRLDQGSKGMLDYLPMSHFAVNTPRSADELFSIGEELLENIYGDEDFGLMAGDIIKSYGSNLIGLVEVPEVYTIVPMYDEYVLSQFRNAKVVGPLGYKSLDQISQPGTPWDWKAPFNSVTVNPLGAILQNTKGDIVSREAIVPTISESKKVANVMSILPTLVDVRNMNPTPEDVIEATRLQCYIDEIKEVSYDESSYKQFFLYNGTEIVTDCQIFFMTYKNDGQRYMQYKQFMYAEDSSKDLGLLRSFEHTPTVVTCTNVGVPGAPLNNFRFLGNLYNATRLDNEQLQRMHEVALLSLLYIPGIAKINVM